MDSKAEEKVQPLMLDDLSVGQVFLSGTYKLDAEQIMAFAGEYDPQPFHLSDEAAQKTIFAGLAASGWQTASISMRLLVKSVPIAGGLVGVSAELSWPRPTRPGDTLQVESAVQKVTPSRSRPDRGMVTIRSITKNQHGQTVQILVSTVVVPRRQADV